MILASRRLGRWPGAGRGKGRGRSSWAARPFSKDIELSGGAKLRFQSGELARFADGSAVCRLGETAVLATAVSKARDTPLGFLPLTVDFRLKGAAAGRIPSNHLRRELGPSPAETLTSRLIDRSLRPVFPKGYHYDTQLTANVLALGPHGGADVVAINAASAALALSDVPFPNPVAAVRVGLVDGKLLLHPTKEQMAVSSLNLVVAARGPQNHCRVTMIEAEASEVPRREMVDAISRGFEGCQTILSGLKKLVAEHGRPKREWTPKDTAFPPELTSRLHNEAWERVREVFEDASHDKISRDQAISAIREDVVGRLTEEDPESALVPSYGAAFSQLVRSIFRTLTLTTKRRCDGRTWEDIRKTSAQVSLFRPLHGSALFQRGQTQVLASLTFDSPEAAFRGDPVDQLLRPAARADNFMLHYQFPSYAINELGGEGRARANRRELGHGALAEKGLRAIVPSDSPFTVRLSAEVLESNGSSSMASVCAGSLALADAGVAIPRHAAGIAIGMVSPEGADEDETERLGIEDVAILTDISGIEDYMGDMDFKVAGTAKGFTAVQLDTKLPGIPHPLLRAALGKAEVGLGRFLAIMGKALEKPRTEARGNQPQLDSLAVPTHKLAQFLGVGGSNLRRLRAETGVEVKAVGDGSFSVFAPTKAAMDDARPRLDALLRDKEPELDFGAIYTAVIQEVLDGGVRVRIGDGQTLHYVPNSQLDSRRVNHASALGLGKGDELSLKSFGREPDTGKLRLSRKALQVSGGSASSRPRPTEKPSPSANPWASKSEAS